MSAVSKLAKISIQAGSFLLVVPAQTREFEIYRTVPVDLYFTKENLFGEFRNLA
jgi:hypothetical protein